MLTELAIARAVHVAAIVHWIGGVAMVTLVLLPQLIADGADFARFEALERRFAAQARVSVLLAGLSGLGLTWRLGLWPRFGLPGFWWMHAMVALWLVFAAVLYVLEPLILHRWFHERSLTDPGGTMRRVLTLHRVLLAAAAATVAGAAAGSHGLL